MARNDQIINEPFTGKMGNISHRLLKRMFDTLQPKLTYLPYLSPPPPTVTPNLSTFPVCPLRSYFERGLPARPPSSRSSPAQPMAMVTPSKASPSLTPSSTVANHAMPKCISSNGQARGGATGFLAMNSSTGEMRRQQQQQQPTQLADWPKFVGEKCVMG